MKRSEAKNRENERNKITELVPKNQPTTIETDEGTITKFLAGNPYDKKDFEKNVKPLFEKYKHDYDEQFVLVDNIIEFEDSFQNVTVKPGKPIFVVFAKEKYQWILICVIHDEDEKRNVILFKDPCGDLVSAALQKKLQAKFPKCKFIAQSKNDQKVDDTKCYGPLTLRNLDILLEFLNKKSELSKFDSIEFAKAKDLKTGKFEKVVSLATEISENEEYVGALKNFIDKLPLDLGRGVLDYQIILKEELEKDEEHMDADRIKKAREQHMKEEDIKKMKGDYKLNSNTKDEHIVGYQLDIETKFPGEMKKLSDIFQVFDDLKNDKEMSAAVKQVSAILKIDYKKLDELYKYKFSMQKTDETENLTSEDINEIMKNIPDQQSLRYDDCTPLKQLLKEMILGMDEDDSSPAGDSAEDLRKIEEKYHIVKEKYDKWKNTDISGVNDWAKKMKDHLGTTDDDVCEALAVMDRALNLLSGSHRLRDTQILAVLVFFHGQTNQGRLCQIKTGEGKTVIVSLLAVIRVLQGFTVDVITSNPLLAVDGVKETKTFYSVFGLTVSTNNPSDSKIGYLADVLYGTISNFQFDYLKDTFEGFNIRRNRRFGQVILDEVDSMLVDNGGHIAKLAAPYPGMECLRYIYIKIWQELYKAEESFAQEGQDKVKEILSKYQGDEAREEYSKFIKDRIDNERKIIKEKIKAADPTNIPLVPAHLKDYVKTKLDIWLKNALYAKYHCHEHQQYRILTNDSGERVIAPVDYLNTGVTMKNTIWSNGLHQFVQLKHNIYLTFESLTSSFISNIGYIKNYLHKNICGLTGTLGSRAEQELLSSIYTITYAKIPTYKTKKFAELPGIVVPDDSWSTQLTLEALCMVDQQRAVLVILETEHDLLTIKRKLDLLKDDDVRIRTFAHEENAKETNKKVNIGDIILATNIAGRGTNFRTEKTLEEKGGLHVCVGFLPCNLRVEGQAFGRTSRQGNNGTAQLIIRQSEVEELELKESQPDFVQIKKKRDLLERDRLKQINDVLVKELDFKDELFKEFSQLYKFLKNKHIGKESFSYVLQDLKEYWAFWLEKNNFKVPNINNSSPSQAFHNFKNDDITKKILNGVISHNPFYGVMLGDYYLEVEDREKASVVLQHTLEMGGTENQELLAGLHVKLFELAIQNGHQLRERFKKAVANIFFISVDKDNRYKENAQRHLEAAGKAIDKELDLFKTYFDETKEQEPMEDFARIMIPSEDENILLKHMMSRRFFLMAHRENINHLLTEVKEFDGVDLNGKTPTSLDYFNKLNGGGSELKNLTDCEITELHSIGMDALYALKEVHDVPDVLIHIAQGQIIGGIAALCVGLAFFPIFPLMSSIAGTLISEGIIDIVMEILTQGGAEFDAKDYMKGKFVSYGMSLLTFGLGAVTQSVKLLTKAVSFCRKLSTWLRKCKYLKTLCGKLANVVDKIGNKLEKLLAVAKFNKLNAAQQVKEMKNLQKAGNAEMFEKLGGIKKLNELNKLQNLSKSQIALKMTGTFAKENGKRIGKSLVEELVIKPITEQIIKGLTEELINLFKNRLKSSIQSNPKVMEKLRTTPTDQVNETVENFLQTNEIVDLAFAIGKEVVGAFDNAAIDILTSGTSIMKNMTELARLCTCCTSYLENHLPGGTAENNMDEVVENVSSDIAEKMFVLCSDSINEGKKYAKIGLRKIKDLASGKHAIKTPGKKHKITGEKVKNAAKKIAKKVAPLLIQRLLKDAIKQIKKLFQEELAKALRNNVEVSMKLQKTPEEDIDDSIDTFLEGNRVLTIARDVETRVCKAVKHDVADLLLATSNIIMDSVDVVSLCANFTSFLEEKLPGGTSQNNVDKMIDNITTKLADKIFNLLGSIGQNGVTFKKTMDNLSKRDIRKMLNTKSFVSTVFNKENLTQFGKSLIEEEVYQPFIDEFIRKTVEGFKEELQHDLSENVNVVLKIQTTPVKTINSSVQQFVSGNEILNLVESIGTKLFEDSKSDISKVLLGSYTIVRKSVDFDQCKQKFISFLGANLAGGDCNNNTEKIIKEVSSIISEVVSSYLCAIVKGSKDLVDVGKKIKLEHLTAISFDKESLQDFGRKISPVLQEEFVNQTSKLFSELKNNDEVNKLLKERFESVLDNILPFYQDEEVENFASESALHEDHQEMEAVTIIKKATKRKLSVPVPECAEEKFFEIVNKDTTSMVKKIKPILEAIAPDLDAELQTIISSSIDQENLEKTLSSQLQISPSQVKEVLKKLLPVLTQEVSIKVVQAVTSNPMVAPLMTTLTDIKPMVQIVVPLYTKELSSQVSLLISNESLKTLLSTQLGTTVEKIEPVLKTVLPLLGEEISKKSSHVAARTDLIATLGKQGDLCKARNVIELVTPFIIEHVSKFVSQLEEKAPIISEEVTKAALECAKNEKLLSGFSLSTIKPLMEVATPIVTTKLSSQIQSLLLHLTTDDSIEEFLSSDLDMSVFEVQAVLKALLPILNKKIAVEMSRSSYRLRYSTDLRQIQREYHVKEVLQALSPPLIEESSQVLGLLTILAENKQVEEMVNSHLSIPVDNIAITKIVALLKSELEDQLPNLVSQVVSNENLLNLLETQLTSLAEMMMPTLNEVLSVVTKGILTNLGTTSNVDKAMQEKINKELSEWVINFPSELKRVFCVQLRGCNEIEALASLLREESNKSTSLVLANEAVQKIYHSQLGTPLDKADVNKIVPILNQELFKQFPRSATKLLSNDNLRVILGSEFGTTKPAVNIVSEDVTSKVSSSLLQLFSSEEFQKKLPAIEKKTELVKTVGQVLMIDLIKQLPKTVSQLILKQVSNLDNVVIKTISPLLKEEILAQVDKTVDNFIEDDENIHDWLCSKLGTPLDDAISLMDELSSTVVEEVTATFLQSVCQQITCEDLKKVLVLEAPNLVEKVIVPLLSQNLVHLSLSEELLSEKLNSNKELCLILTPNFGTTVDKMVPKAEDVLPVVKNVVTEMKKDLDFDKFFSSVDLQQLLDNQIVSWILTALSSKQDVLKLLNVQQLVDFGLLYLPEKIAKKFMEAAEALNCTKEAYEMLELPMDASLSDIKLQYRKVVLELDPKSDPEDQELEYRYNRLVKAYKDIVKSFDN